MAFADYDDSGDPWDNSGDEWDTQVARYGYGTTAYGAAPYGTGKMGVFVNGTPAR